MNPWPDKETLAEIATLKSIEESFVEKDWLVTQIISITERIKHEDFRISRSLKNHKNKYPEYLFLARYKLFKR